MTDDASKQNGNGILEPDREQIETFISLLFRHAGDDGYVSIRAFYDDSDDTKPFCISPMRLNHGHKLLADAVVDDARRCANSPRRVVFCPPIAVFSNRDHAREQDIFHGLVLSVECDQRPRAARERLEQLLGPATIVVASGGQWIDPKTGEVEAKLHLHWRLKEPVQDKAALADLKTARDIAAKLVGGDPTNKPIVHPIRWPGSWHRKGEPKLCHIVTTNADREIDLSEALAALKEAVPIASDDNPRTAYGNATQNWGELIGAVLTAESYHDPLIRLAAKLIKSGMDDGSAVNLLRAWMEASTGERDARWQARYNDIGRCVSTAKEKFEKPAEVVSIPLIDMSRWDHDPVPQQEWAVSDRIPLRKTTILSGPGAVGKSLSQLHLSVAHVLGREWLGVTPRQGPALFIDAEDDPPVLHRRLADILRYYGARFADVVKAGLHLVSLSGQDAVLGWLNRKSGKIEPTPLYGKLLEMVGDLKPVMTGIASSADVFAGSEIDRSQVQQFVALLTRLAGLSGGGVVLISHPSLTGINTGSGLSGSTQWHNSVRARMYMETPRVKEDEQPDTDLRVIHFMKNNYGRTSESITVRYQDGLFLPVAGTDFGAAVRHETAKEVFLALLRRFTKENRNVNANSGRNYAPVLFAVELEATCRSVSKSDLAAAMRELLHRGQIRQEPYGRPSRPNFRLVVSDPV
jgi:RecA-family ATPase